MRRLPLLLAALIPFTATVLTVQPARADDSNELIQDELRVAHAPDGTPPTVVTSRVVNAAGDVIHTTTETLNNPPFRAQQADFPCMSEGQRAGFATHDVKHLLHKTHNDHAEFNFFPYSADNIRISSVREGSRSNGSSALPAGRTPTTVPGRS